MIEITRIDEIQAHIIADMMTALEQEIHDRRLFIADDLDFIRNHVEKDGFTLLAGVNEVPAGFLIVDLPGKRAHHLGLDLGWTEERRLKSAHMESTGVMHAFRGMGLQKQMISEAEKRLMALGYTGFLATTAPENLPSLHSFQRMGYRIGAEKEKYGGVRRYILWKEV